MTISPAQWATRFVIGVPTPEMYGATPRRGYGYLIAD